MTDIDRVEHPPFLDEVASKTSTPVLLIETHGDRRTALSRHRIAAMTMMLVMTDVACLVAPALWNARHAKALASMSLLCVALFGSGGLYRPRLQALALDELPMLIGRGMAAIGVVATVTALRHAGSSVPGFLVGAAVGMGLLVTGRVATCALIRAARRKGILRQRVLLVGSGGTADRIVRSLRTTSQYGMEVVAYVADHRAQDASATAGLPYAGSMTTLKQAIADCDVQVVVISDDGFTEANLLLIAREALRGNCDIFMVPRLHEVTHQPAFAEMIGSVPVVRFSLAPGDTFGRYCKRAFDVIVAGAAAALLSPILISVAGTIVLLDGGQILFRQQRVGRNGKIFELVKFRTMRPLDDDESATLWSISGDARVTRFGHLLRRTSIDELPQLWNILRGDMTVVGPRPERPHFVEKFSSEEPVYALRHRVPSGLTGLAQVNGLRGDTSISERSRLDNYYIENWSMWLDVKVVLRTIFEVLGARGS